MSFVCGPCREQAHEGCRGQTWCDCQHKVPRERLIVIDWNAGVTVAGSAGC